MNVDLTKLQEYVTQFFTALMSGNIAAVLAAAAAIWLLFIRKPAVAKKVATDDRAAAALLLLGPDADKALTKAVADKFKG